MGMQRPRRTLALLALLPALLLAAPQQAWSADTVVKASEPATSVSLLSAPHVGKTLCDVPGGTPVTFLARAPHGPHLYARIVVLEGGCAGQEGYVPWMTLDPEPAEQ
ncbi:MAG TPA: hypothetical protein VJL84_08015 [Kiloniellales bacterium]|nr:hypothetical protein [Kiloniellales bacterium]